MNRFLGDATCGHAMLMYSTIRAIQASHELKLSAFAVAHDMTCYMYSEEEWKILACRHHLGAVQ